MAQDPRYRTPGPLSRPALTGPPLGRAAALQAGQQALQRYVPPIPEPPVAASFAPILGAGWQAGRDLQRGEYERAVLNGGLAALEALPGAVAIKGLVTASKVNKELGNARRTAEKVQRAFHNAELAGPADDVHHVFPLNGVPRDVENWRNNLAFMKAMPRDQHHRLHTAWKQQPKYGPLARAWYGTTDWMKAAPTGLAAYGADSVENANRPPPPEKPKR